MTKFDQSCVCKHDRKHPRRLINTQNKNTWQCIFNIFDFLRLFYCLSMCQHQGGGYFTFYSSMAAIFGQLRSHFTALVCVNTKVAAILLFTLAWRPFLDSYAPMGKLFIIRVLSHTFHCNWNEISRGITGVFALRWGPQWRIFGRYQLKDSRVISNHVYGKHEFLTSDQVFPLLVFNCSLFG